jgi:hypothetical protein
MYIHDKNKLTKKTNNLGQMYRCDAFIYAFVATRQVNTEYF